MSAKQTHDEPEELIDALSGAIREATRALQDHRGKLTEHALKDALRHALDDKPGGLALKPTEHAVTLGGWPKVGTVDLALLVPEDRDLSSSSRR